MANFVNNKNVSKSLSIASGPKSFARQCIRPITSNKWEIGKGTGVQVASFLIKTIALETIRRFSRAKCPFLWTGLQGLQVLCYPPLKWIQCWKPFGLLVKGMQMISRPLLVLSIANAFSDDSDGSNSLLDDTENSPSIDDSQLGSENLSGSPSLQCNQSTRSGGENPQGHLSTDWINHLCQELENQGITLPERINEEELQRFYVAANGDLSTLLSSVKKTIRWRETYRILSGEELELWSNMVFWHGLDVNHRPCLIVRLGLACSRLPPHDKPRFAQAVVQLHRGLYMNSIKKLFISFHILYSLATYFLSEDMLKIFAKPEMLGQLTNVVNEVSQVEHGVLHLVDGENPQITVLVDCQGLSPLRLPIKMMGYCCNILQDHFPNVLGCLIVIRLPSVVRVIAQTFIQVLKPATKQKLRIEGEPYQRVLSECFQRLPSYLGGLCTCTRCAKLDAGNLGQISDRQTSITESVSDIVNAEDFPSVQPTHQYDMVIENHCSRTLRTAVIGVLIIWLLIAFIEGIYNPESRPILPP